MCLNQFANQFDTLKHKTRQNLTQLHLNCRQALPVATRLPLRRMVLALAIFVAIELIESFGGRCRFDPRLDLRISDTKHFVSPVNPLMTWWQRHSSWVLRFKRLWTWLAANQQDLSTVCNMKNFNGKLYGSYFSCIWPCRMTAFGCFCTPRIVLLCFTLARLTPLVGSVALTEPEAKRAQQVEGGWLPDICRHCSWRVLFAFVAARFVEKTGGISSILQWRRCLRESNPYFLKKLGDGMVPMTLSRWRTIWTFETFWNVQWTVVCRQPYASTTETQRLQDVKQSGATGIVTALHEVGVSGLRRGR